eukprot:TRINITY_DN75225_c0_g1_i1.p1 TRINITY_DN75225_c0_g1~~TRINITY_DN75225_c0_g1_i1.p1  ORF type:complete len:380 (-),score=49.77 TRINITY_DN75225_c0_g1_i1:112-1251(-)
MKRSARRVISINGIRSCSRVVALGLMTVVVMAVVVMARVADEECSLPPQMSVYQPPINTALASHARAGSTWLRFLLERSIGLPCGFERALWANVLPHFGENLVNPDMPNQHGLVIKTHNSCYGCWSGASLDDRLTIERNSTVNPQHLQAAMGETFYKRLREQGVCLIATGISLTTHLEGALKGRTKKVENLPCDGLVYDRAVFLVRHPLDNIKSNYHYRTSVVKNADAGTWASDNYSFPQERGEAWVRIHRSWLRFAEVRPVLIVRYEDMKQNTTRELRRIVDFLGFGNVSDSRLECAVSASTMEELQKSDRFNMQMDASFFGTRGLTEQREQLSFPPWLLSYFGKIGMFNVAHVLGYQDVHDDSKFAKQEHAELGEEL